MKRAIQLTLSIAAAGLPLVLLLSLWAADTPKGDQVAGQTHGAEAPDDDNDNLVLLTIPLGYESSRPEIQRVEQLEQSLESILSKKPSGQYDGNEVGPDEYLIYLYASDADAVLDSIMPSLQSFMIKPIKVRLQYGSSDNSSKTKTRELTID